MHDSQAYVLRALTELTAHIRVLTNDVFALKSSSIMVEKEIYDIIKTDVVEEINRNVSTKFGIVEGKLSHIYSALESIKRNTQNVNKAENEKSKKDKTKEDNKFGKEEVIKEADTQEEVKEVEETKEEVIENKESVNRKSYKDAVKGLPKEKKNKRYEKRKVTWFGTSVSKVLDRNKFEQETNAKLREVRAYCIKGEGKFPKSNFCAIVPNELRNHAADVAVLQTGSIEITNIDVKKAMMDHNKDIKEYEREWSAKVEKDSENLFNLASKVSNEHPNLEVVILKRMDRFDEKTHDPLSIRRKLSNFANTVYDQLWFKHGRPNNIKIKTLNLGCSESQYLKKIIMGNPENQAYDGVHLRGTEAGRHFTYRAVQAISGAGFFRYADHSDCPQTKFQQRQSQPNHGRNRMSTNTQSANQTTSDNYRYNVPTQNSFNVLGN